jgi:hypothetical protein
MVMRHCYTRHDLCCQPSSGTLTFTPGQTEQVIMVDVLGDTLAEPDELFSITLSTSY